MQKFRLLLAVLITVGFSSACTAEDLLVQMTPGQPALTQIPANSPISRINWAYFSNTKNSTSTLSLDISAPARTVVSVKALGVPSSYTIEQAMAAFKSAYPLEIAVLGGKPKKSITLGSTSSGGSGGGSDMMCNGLLDRNFSSIPRNFYKGLFNRDPSDDELCDFIFGEEWRTNGGGGGGDSGSSTTAISHILKSACANSTTKTLVVVTTNIEKTDKSTGFTMSLTPNESVYKGAQAQKLKIGDGKIHGWIHMADMVGSDFGMVAKFTSGKIVRMTALQKEKIGKYAPYRSHVLAVYPIAKLGRSGGRATFYNANSEVAFGACFAAGGNREQWTPDY